MQGRAGAGRQLPHAVQLRKTGRQLLHPLERKPHDDGQHRLRAVDALAGRPRVRQIRPQQHQVARFEVAQMVADVALPPRIHGQGQLELRVVMPDEGNGIEFAPQQAPGVARRDRDLFE
ncbi:hypothetical protein D3C72_1274920 [compost metagenome]